MKKLLALVIGVFGLVAASPAHGQVALPRAGWVATASTTNSGEPAGQAIDGSATTRFSTGTEQTAGQWFSIDMLAPQSFSQITIDPSGSTNDWIRGYQVFVSNDAVDWGAPVASGIGTSGVLTIMFPMQTARFVGIVQTGSASNWWSIGEINVYGPGATPTVLLSPTGWVATASATGGSDVASRAIDGNLNTRWSTGTSQVNGQSFQVDMLQQQTIAKVVMDSGGSSTDYARSFQVFISNSTSAWGAAVATGIATSSPITVTFAQTTGRYLQIVQTGSASNWWSIAELSVYGVGTFAPVAMVMPRTGWVASASASCSSDTPSKALDDDLSTRFSTCQNQTSGQSFQVDMLTPRAFTKITLDAGSSNSDYPRGYIVYVSQDGTNWGSAIATGAGSGQLVTIAFAYQNARYIKVVQTGAASNWWSIYEFNVYGIPPYLLVRDGWVASASLNSGTATAGIDGKLSTRWATSTPQANGQWYQLDMLAPQTFNQITLNVDGATSDYPRGFQVFASNDPANWGPAVASGVGSASIVSISFSTQQSRYLRVVQTGSSSNWWSIAEALVMYQPGQCEGQSPAACLSDLRFIETTTQGFEDSYLQAASDLDELIVRRLEGDPSVTTAAQVALVAQKDQMLSLLHGQTVARNSLANLLLAQNVSDAPATLTAVVGQVALIDFRNALGLWAPAGLFDDSCRDIVRDQLLIDLFNAVLSNNRPSYGLALGHIERALQCTDLNNALLLEDALIQGYNTTVGRFAVALRPAVERTLTSALLNVFILLQDDTKIVGPTSLYRWLRAHRLLVAQVLSEPNSLVRLAGLWLRHPSGDRLVQVTNLCEDGLNNPLCISVGHLVDALIDPTRVGLGNCTALEVVTATFDPQRGYRCDKGLCVKDPIENVFTASPTSAFQNLLDANGNTRFGSSIAQIQQDACAAANTNSGSSGGLPDDGSGWLGVASCDLFDASEQAIDQILCLADSAQPNPLFRLGEVLLNNGWPADACGPSAAADENATNTSPVNETIVTGKRDAETTINDPDWESMIRTNAANGPPSYSITPANFQQGSTAVQNARVVSRNAINSKDKNCKGKDGCTISSYTPIVDSNGNVTGYNFTYQIFLASDYTASSNVSSSNIKDLLIHEALHVILTDSAKGDVANFSKLTDQNRQDKLICGGLGATGCKMCNPGDDQCGSCSPAATALRNTLGCFVSAIDAQGLPQVAPIARLIYPTEDQTSSAWAACFRALDHGLLAPESSICTMVHCGDQTKAAYYSAACSCVTPAGGIAPPLYNRCIESIMCADGTPVVVPTGCTCATLSGGLSTQSPIVQ